MNKVKVSTKTVLQRGRRKMYTLVTHKGSLRGAGINPPQGSNICSTSRTGTLEGSTEGSRVDRGGITGGTLSRPITDTPCTYPYYIYLWFPPPAHRPPRLPFAVPLLPFPLLCCHQGVRIHAAYSPFPLSPCIHATRARDHSPSVACRVYPLYRIPLIPYWSLIPLSLSPSLIYSPLYVLLYLFPSPFPIPPIRHSYLERACYILILF